MKIKFTFSVSCLLVALLGTGQVLYPDTYFVDYYKTLELQNEGFRKNKMIHTSSVSLYEHDSLPKWNPWGDQFPVYTIKKNAKSSFHVLPVVTSVSVNSKYPRGYNDGPVWKGKGANADVNFGVKGHYGILHYTLAPVVFFAQNADFERVNRGVNDSLYNYQFSSRIDWIQRYGPDPITKFSLGQSEVRLVWKGLTLGASTQNITMGPANVNPIMLSNNGPMFPHIDFGTDTPIETKIGDFEFRSIWGVMKESDYFDHNPDNNLRYFQGGGLFWQPSFLPGFSFGMTRIHYRALEDRDFEFSDLVVSFADFSSNTDTLSSGSVVNDLYDQMTSANFKWTFEEVGFEAYLELARNDFSNLRSIFTEPEHSRAYTIGFVKTMDIGNGRAFKGMYEHTNLGRPRLKNLRPATPIYYTHNFARQGYTHLGQVLGAGIGPGGSGDILTISYYYPKGLLGYGFQRIRFNDDYAFDTFGSTGKRPFDTEYTMTLKAVRFVNDLVFGADLTLGKRLNWNYIYKNDVVNVYGKVTIAYLLR
ncbi:MAG: capsule assembly Wzi family protein [Marinoscillum sp.]|uniref:capsule assembly Wzi family protein n=1 Tax=Marinoscillum sp. TaxID=2024838 RepID=UPI0032F93EF5